MKYIILLLSLINILFLLLFIDYTQQQMFWYPEFLPDTTPNPIQHGRGGGTLGSDVTLYLVGVFVIVYMPDYTRRCRTIHVGAVLYT